MRNGKRMTEDNTKNREWRVEERNDLQGAKGWAEAYKL